MGRIVIACYRPRPGCAPALRALIVDHVATLRSLGLVTDRAPITMEAKDGTIVEVFEWRSREAIDSAHSHPAVQQMWAKYSEVCDYVPITEVPEAAEMFAEFTPVEGIRTGARAAMPTPPRPGSPPRPDPEPPPPHNEFGDPVDTLYAGGTPAFDETGGSGKRR